MSDKLYTVSIKGASQSQAWVVVNADSAQELHDALDALADHEEYGHSLYQKVADANASYQAVANVANPSGRAPAPAPSSPAGSGEPAQEPQAAAPAPARQRGGNSSYGRRKPASGGGRKPKLTYEEASADCAHGERRRFTKPDVDWVLYGCPLDKNDPNNCGPNFINKSDDQEG